MKKSFETSFEVFRDGYYWYGKGSFTYGINITPHSSGFDWEIDIPKQRVSVFGHKYDEETGEDEPFLYEFDFNPLTYKIKLKNKENILNGQFIIENARVDPKAGTLYLEF